jgi:hypothetical protein
VLTDDFGAGWTSLDCGGGPESSKSSSLSTRFHLTVAPSVGIDPIAPSVGIDPIAPSVGIDPIAPSVGIDPIAPSDRLPRFAQSGPIVEIDWVAPSLHRIAWGVR